MEQDLAVESSLNDVENTPEQTEALETNQEVVEQPVAEDSTPEAANEETTDGKDAKPELPRGVEKRFAKMTKEKYTMQRELQALREQVESFSKKPEPEYLKEDFGEDEQAYLDYEFEKRLIKHKAEEQKQYAEQQAAVNQQEAALGEWNNKIANFEAELPDYREVVENTTVDFSPEDIQNIMESEVGPKIAYQLSADEALANQFTKLPSQRARDRFITKMELKMEMAPAAPTPAKPAVSQAPAPTPKLNAGKGGVNKDPSQMSMDEYVRWRNGE